MFAFNALEANHGPESVSVSAFGLVFPGETPHKVELKQFLDTFQDSMDQKPYGAILRGELPFAVPSLAPRKLEAIPSIADAALVGFRDRGDASSAACSGGAQKQDQARGERRLYATTRTVLLPSILAMAMRPEAGLKLRKLQSTYALTVYPIMYDGIQMCKELKYELTNLHDAYDSDEHERKIELMRDDLLPDNCTGQGFADKVNTLIIRVITTRIFRCPTLASGSDVSSSSSCRLAALAGEGRALLRERVDKKTLATRTR
eukprot:4866882-Pleurochrysis_carterae.AAC.6